MEMTKLFDGISGDEVLDENVEKFVAAFFKKSQILFDFQAIYGLVTEKFAQKRGSK